MTAYYTGNYHNLVGYSQKLQQMQSLSTPSATPQDLRNMACREENPTCDYDSSPPPKLTRIHSNLPRVSNSRGELVGKIAPLQAHISVQFMHPIYRSWHRNQSAWSRSSDLFGGDISLALRRQNLLSPLPTMLHNRSTNLASYLRFIIRSRQHKTQLSALLPRLKSAEISSIFASTQ